MKLGAHVPTGKGLAAAVREGAGWGCEAVQVFTSSPRMWKGGVADPAKAADLRAAAGETGVPLVSHDTYLVNLCHPEGEIAEKSYACLKGEIERCAAYGIPWVVSHVGAAMGREPDEALRTAAFALRRLLAETPPEVTILMETTAGQGSVIHARFEEIARTLEAAGAPDRLAVCLDTCHVHAAGYDLSTDEGYDACFAAFDRLVGLDRLRVLHLNDSVHPAGSRKDRHAAIGGGTIGEGAFRRLVNDPRFINLPAVLETPTEDEGHRRDLERLKGYRGLGLRPMSPRGFQPR